MDNHDRYCHWKFLFKGNSSQPNICKFSQHFVPSVKHLDIWFKRWKEIKKVFSKLRLRLFVVYCLSRPKRINVLTTRDYQVKLCNQPWISCIHKHNWINITTLLWAFYMQYLDPFCNLNISTMQDLYLVPLY